MTTDPATGQITYKGHAVEMSAGKPCVLTTSGWVNVADFEASALTEEDLQTARVLATSSGRMARLRAEGPQS